MSVELTNLKKLVQQFLHEIRYVTLRAVDCDQFTVEELWLKLDHATKPKKRKKAKK